MAGAGLDPRRGLLPPFMRADSEGLDTVLERLEARRGEVGRALRAADDPAAPRRPGPPRRQDRPGLLHLPAARRGRADRDGEARDPRRRGDRLAGQRPGQLDLPAGHRGPRARCGTQRQGRRRDPRARSSPPPTRSLFSAGADIKAFTKMDAAAGEELHRHAPRADARARSAGDPTIAAVNASPSAAAASWRWPATSGSPPSSAMLRPARDQARDHPRLRRHAAPAAARRRGQGAGDEPDRRRDLGRGGLRARPRQPLVARPRAARDGAELGAQARRPGAARRRADQAGLRARATSTRASRPRSAASRPPSRPRTRSEGIGAFLGKRSRSSQGSSRRTSRRDRWPSSSRRGGLGGRADRRGDLGAVRDPRLPLARDRAVGERRPDGGRPHRRLPARPRALLAASTATASSRCATRSPTARTARWPSSSARGLLDAVITQNIDRLHARGGDARAGRGPRLDRAPSLVPGVRRAATRSTRSARGWRPTRGGVPALRVRRAAEARRRAVRRVPARGGDAARPGARREAPTCCCASAPRSRSIRWPSCPRSRSPRAGGRARHRGPDALRLAARRSSSTGDVVDELEALLDPPVALEHEERERDRHGGREVGADEEEEVPRAARGTR